MDIELNYQQHLYVIRDVEAVSCLGFGVCVDRTRAIARELGRNDLLPTSYATRKAYRQYQRALNMARLEFRSTGRRLTCELTPQLVGLEGKRVAVVDDYGVRRRFIVGKSTGWIPIHLEIRTRRSSGGLPVMGAPFRSVHVVPS